MRKVLVSGLLVLLMSPATTWAQELDSSANHLLESVQAFTWQPPVKSAKSVSFQKLVGEVGDTTPVELAIARIDEAKAEAQKLKTQNNILFMLIPPKYLDEAGQEQVLAAERQKDAAVQKTLLENSRLYFDLMNAHMAQVAAYYQLQAVEEQLKLDESRFKLGEVTSLAVIQTQNNLLKAYEDFKQADLAVNNLSLAVATLIDEHSGPRYLPTELALNAEEGGSFLSFAAAPRFVLPEETPEKSLDSLVKMAEKQQPELIALQHQRKALEHMLEGSGNKNDPQHKLLKAQLKQTEILIDQAEEGLSSKLRSVLNDRSEAEDALTRAHAQLSLAQKALHHVQISHKSGFSNKQDLLSAKATLVQARANYAKHQLDRIYQDMVLLHSMGLLYPSIVTSSQPITLSNVKGQI